jgi:hypothetical protein
VVEGNIAPCVYPGCMDVDGNPRLTREVICGSSRRHYRMLLDRLVCHYKLLRADLPQFSPPTDERLMRVASREYGHPAEWASDAARSIADHLNWTHDALAEHLSHDPPPHPGSREVGRVAVAHHYLAAWFDDLCVFPGAGDTATATYDLDREIRRGLGMTNPVWHVPLPCPVQTCGLLTLYRHAGENECVECRACGQVIRPEHYGLLARMILDEMIGDPPAA